MENVCGDHKQKKQLIKRCKNQQYQMLTRTYMECKVLEVCQNYLADLSKMATLQ